MSEHMYAKGEIKDFEIKMLASENCEAFLPMRFIISEEGISARYDYEKYIPLKDMVGLSSMKLLEIAEYTVECISRAWDNLIVLGRYELNADNLYISETGIDARLEFIPVSAYAERKGDFSQMFSAFIEGVAELADERAKKYAEILVRDIKRLSLGRQATLNLIRKLKREVYSCEWER